MNQKDSIATEDDIAMRVLRRRKRNIEKEWRQLQRDVAHWNSLHPDEEPIVIEPITEAEIEAIKADPNPCPICDFPRIEGSCFNQGCPNAVPRA